MNILFYIFNLVLYFVSASNLKLKPCDHPDPVVPSLNAKEIEFGIIGIIGGSAEHPSFPYLAAISAMKIGAYAVHVISTKRASPLIKAYNPNIIVYPYLNHKSRNQIDEIITKMDLLIIGPGLHDTQETTNLILDLIQVCRNFRKPLVIHGDGVDIIAKKLLLLMDYPNGVIITLDQSHMIKLTEAVGNVSVTIYDYLGVNVSVLLNSGGHHFYNKDSSLNFFSQFKSPGRRVADESYVFVGVLATLYNWSLKAKRCKIPLPVAFATSGACFASLKLMNDCNDFAFYKMGRGMTATEIIEALPKCFRYFYNEFDHTELQK